MIPEMLTEAAEEFPTAAFDEVLGDTVVRVERSDLAAFVGIVRDAGFDLFIDLCAVDYLSRTPRFDVVINLVSVDVAARLRILAGVPGDDPSAPTITGVFPGADFYEREAFDLLGIDFSGHPDLTRILLPDEWEGHPLRKDSPVGSIPVQFKGANKTP